ncbi:hypothetical protein HBN50_08050 [Halobacteriovorax sp. GB3]|uniref:hypothetical protein n=1 Tax=Halobacteriovorax sp. GB3 TaxID=2719615 RepID=UPI002362C023|nr:hypothetical protein [Halobacteriovorax sp. GB3]MDD0853044.1 hypothetical protein [Halobacteriovorax sp. GB3]
MPKTVIAESVESILMALSENSRSLMITLKERPTEKNITSYIPFKGRGGDPRLVDNVISHGADYDLYNLNLRVNNPEDGQDYNLNCTIVTTESDEIEQSSNKLKYTTRLYGCYIESDSPAAAFSHMNINTNFHQISPNFSEGVGMIEWTHEEY